MFNKDITLIIHWPRTTLITLVIHSANMADTNTTLGMTIIFQNWQSALKARRNAQTKTMP